MKRKALALTIILALLFSAFAVTHFVKPVNARTITVPNDYSTIQSAINAANNGDTVFVKSGYYPETLTVNKSVSVIGEDREQTVIDAQKSSPVVLIAESGVTFTDFTLGNTYKPEGYGRYLMVKGIEFDNYVANCYIANNRLVSIFGSAFWIPWTANNNIIENNILINCSQSVAFLGSNNNNVFEGNEEVTFTDVPSPFPSPSPSPETTSTPTSTPDQGTQQTDLLQTILAVALIVAVVCAGLGLLIYFRKRKR